MKLHPPRMQENIIKIPTSPVCRICNTNFTDWCNDCLDHNLDRFDIKPGLTLADLPPFPTKEFTNGMPVSMRQLLVAIYLEKIVELLR